MFFQAGASENPKNPHMPRRPLKMFTNSPLRAGGFFSIIKSKLFFEREI